MAVMRLSKVYLITLLITLTLFLAPSILTFGAPAYDGQRVDGFPLTFRITGGMCIDIQTNMTVECGNKTIDIIPFIIDLVFVFGVPTLVQVYTTRRRRSIT